MKDDIKSFKENFDLSLDNIRVTEELKKKTLEKCSKQNVNWLRYTGISAAAVLAIIVLINNPFSHSAKPNANLALNKNVDSINQPPIIQNTAPEIQKPVEIPDPAENTVQNANVPQQVETIPNENNNSVAINTPVTAPVAVETNAVQAKGESPSESTPAKQDNSSTALIADSPGRQNPIPNTSDNGSVRSLGIAAPAVSIDIQLQKAKDYLKENLLLPSYVPEGFKLTSVYVPDENNKNDSYVELKYSFNENYFSILEDKKLDMNLDDYNKITINSTPAYIRVIPSTQYAEVVWLYSKIKYSINGNIPEETLIDIAKSLK